MHPRSELLFETPEWFDEETAERMKARFSQLRTFGLYQNAGSLGGLDKLGLLPEGDVKVFEFGSGMGEGLITLDMFAKNRDGISVKGSELDAYKRRVARKVASTLTAVESVGSNGLEELAKAETPFDLIMANMFGPCYYDDVLVAKFVPAALEKLNPDGAVIINSDSLTMDKVNDWAARNLSADQVTMLDPEVIIPQDLKITLPQTVISR